MAVFGITGVVALIVGLALIWVGVQHRKGKMNIFKAFGAKRMTAAMLGGVVIGVGAILAIGSLYPLGGTFLGGIPIISNLIPDDQVDTSGLLSAGDTQTDSQDQPALANTQQKSISTLNVILERGIDGNPSAVNGHFEVFSASTNPSGANANPIYEAALSTGVSSLSPTGVFCNKDYRIVFQGNGSTSFYDKDYGVTKIVCPDSDESSVTATFDGGSLDMVGTVDDIFDETGTGANGVAMGNASSGSTELVCDGAGSACGADDTVYYDESAGDENFYIDFVPSCSTGNAMCKDYVLLFDWDDTNPPEGDELSSLSAQLQTGTDFGIPSNILDYWSNEIPLELGTLKAGQSATYRFTFGITEANTDANDDWTLRADDLGDYLGKDVRLGTKATADTFTFGGSQA